MGGGLMQLVIWRSNIYLTGNPQITFSKLFIEDILILLWKVLANFQRNS